MKLLLASLLLIGTLGKLSCARLPNEEDGLERTLNDQGTGGLPEIMDDDSWVLSQNTTSKPTVYTYKYINFGKFKNGDLLLKSKSFHKLREKGAKGIIKERLEFAAENGQKIDQVRLTLIGEGKTYKGQSYKFWPKSLRKKPAKNVTVEVYNKKKGGILAYVQVFGH